MSLEHPDRKAALEAERTKLVEKLGGIGANSQVPMSENEAAAETSARIVAIDQELEGLTD